MLFDPKWEVRQDPLSIESLIEWLERQPADKEYDFLDSDNCLLGQYFTEKLGSPKMSVTATLEENMNTPLARFYRVAMPGDGKLDGTFGDALQRARKLCGND